MSEELDWFWRKSTVCPNKANPWSNNGQKCQERFWYILKNKVLAFHDLLISTFALLFNGLCVDQAIDTNQEEHQANVQCPMNIP